jgi:hypothetical protein
MRIRQSSLEKKSAEIIIETWEGSEAISKIDSPEFKKQWNLLVHHCGYGSVFQAPGFVIPWYRGNVKEFTPVVLVAFVNARLIGLLTLTRKLHDRDKEVRRRLVGAGNFYALYQTWIVEEPFVKEFWSKGVKNILDKYPGCVINLKSLPNTDILNELVYLPDFRTNTVLEKFHNPVLDFAAEGYDKIFAKRHFKSKINRLNKAGNVQFEKITTLEKLKSVFPTLTSFYALRQGAAFNKIPYLSHDEEMELFSAWFQEGILHMTCLWLDDSLIGAIAMMDDFGKTGHLAGFITYSPTHARFSPGLVQLYYHATLLKEEHFQNLKLSPGYDAYKDRFSNKYEEIHELMISKNGFQLAKRKLRIRFRKILLEKGIRPMELEVNLSKWRSKAKKWPLKFWRSLNANQISIAQIVEKIGSSQMKDPSFSVISNQDGLAALLFSDDSTFDVSRWEFLNDALTRLEKNERFLACSKGSKLLVCVWYTDDVIDSPNDLMELEKNGKISKIFISPHFK